MRTPTKLIPGVRPVGWLLAFMLAASATFVALRLVTPGDGTQVPPRTWAWTGAGVIVDAGPERTLRDRDLITTIGGVALGGVGRGWRVPAHQPGHRLVYQLVRDGRTQQVTVTLRPAEVAGPLLGGWATILFVAAFFGVVAYLYARRAGPATAALLVLGSGLLSSTLTFEIGISAVDARGGLVLWLYLFNTHAVYVMGWAGLVAFVLLFPRPWPPLGRHHWLLPVAFAAPPTLLVAWALAAMGAVGLTRGVGRVIAGDAVLVMVVLGAGIVLGMVRYLTELDRIGRQQLRWLAGGGCLSATLALALWFLPELVMGEPLLAAEWLGLTGLPLVAGLTVAVLHDRLFDLDRIISRTLAYALLTVLLGGGYVGVVLGLGQLLGRDSPLVVAMATLAMAALFQPARRRVQAVVDHRFNRRRYDAARTIEAFSGRLRQQIDLDTLTIELLTVVEQTMQPTQVLLWLRPTLSAESLQLSGGGSLYRTRGPSTMLSGLPEVLHVTRAATVSVRRGSRAAPRRTR